MEHVFLGNVVYHMGDAVFFVKKTDQSPTVGYKLMHMVGPTAMCETTFPRNSHAFG